MTVDEVFISAIPDNIDDDNMLIPIVKQALEEAVDKRRKFLSDQGLELEGIEIAVILSLELNLKTDARILQRVFEMTPEEMQLQVQIIAQELDIDNAFVTVLKTSLKMQSFPLLKSLCLKSKTHFINACKYYKSTEDLNINLHGTLKLVTGKIIKVMAVKTTILARYARCPNEGCRSDSPIQIKNASRCEKCRKVLVNLGLLDVLVHVRDAIVYVKEWNSTITVRDIPEDLKLDKVYCFLGYPRCDMNSYYFELVGFQKIDPSPTTISEKMMVLDEHYLTTLLKGSLSLIREVRMLQLLEMFTPKARILMISPGDPWHYRLASKFISVIEGRSSVKLKKFPLSDFDIVLDWTRPSDDNLISSMILHNTLTPPAACPLAKSGKIDFTEGSSRRLQNYFQYYHDTACRLNDGATLPMHQPARQITLLKEIAIQAATWRRSDKVSPCDVMIAECLGDEILRSRYGPNALDYHKDYTVDDGDDNSSGFPLSPRITNITTNVTSNVGSMAEDMDYNSLKLF